MRWPLRLYRVRGRSMLPSLHPGDIVICTGWFIPRPGQIVVARLERLVIKRVIRITGQGVWLEGDNPPASTDSRHVGYVNPRRLAARVIFHISPS